MLFVIKRNGKTQKFDSNKIVHAIEQAFKDVENTITTTATKTAESIAFIISQNSETLTVEQIQDKVEELLMSSSRKDVARAYIQWRYKRSLIRRENTTDKSLIELLTGNSEYWNDENANKNSKVVHTQRDYIAGITSTDITRRLLLPPDIVKAHDEGIIHFHDADYFAQNVLSNCCLINLEDMLQNGTCINGVFMEKPHRLITATTIATQIITAVSSSQYGGCTISLTHLAPFVNESRKRYIRKYMSIVYGNQYQKYSDSSDIDPEEQIYLDEEKLIQFNDSIPEDGLTEKMKLVYKLVNESLNKEIVDAMQTFNYQINSMTTTNGQAPFISVCMYLNEAEDERTKKDLALLIEQMLKQRIVGFKNKKGVYITPAFPKLLYFLEDDNIHPDSQYYYLTKLACECTAKRMVPDYISEKVMKELKGGEVYPCMGCVEGNEIITYKFNGHLYVESFERFWNRVSLEYTPQNQNMFNDNLYIDLNEMNVEIYDTSLGFVRVKKLIRNHSSEWCSVHLSNGRSVYCTLDHPFPTNRGRIRADELKIHEDIMRCNLHQYSEECINISRDLSWLLGFVLSFSQSIRKKLLSDSEHDMLQDIFESRLKSSLHIDESCSIDKLSTLFTDLKNIISDKLMRLLDFTNHPHIPNKIFSANKEAKLSFLAGVIDGGGFISSKLRKIQLSYTNKELALQTLALIQSLNVFSSIYINDVKARMIYNVEFEYFDEIRKFMVINPNIPEGKKYGRCFSSSFIERKSNTLPNIEDDIQKDKAFIESQIHPHVSHVIYFNKPMFSYDVETETDHFEVSTIYSHNCRSFLTPDRTTSNLAKAHNYKGHKYYGRFNQGVVSINLVDVAFSSDKDLSKFEQLLDERLELCHKALRIRHDRLRKGVSNMAPIMWQDGALARLEKDESIEKLLYDGYSTISLGYAGLYECVKWMTGESLTTEKGREFALHVLNRLNDKCKEWKYKENIDYSVYGTPIESTTYKFANNLKRRFGNDIFIRLDGHDRNYITNSYHIPVFEKIDPFEKLKIESEYQKLSPGGAISYIECSDLTKNTDAIMSVVKFIYDNIMYAELNTKSDYCQVCGFDGEIQIIDADNRLKWKCPNCGNMDQTKMNVARRTCGYIGTNFFNQGRTNEIRDRYVHLDNHDVEI